MGKETINELILELDELIYRKETELKKLENIYYKDNKIRSCLYDEYSKKNLKLIKDIKKTSLKYLIYYKKKVKKLEKFNLHY